MPFFLNSGFDTPTIVGLAVALGSGLLVGLERERRKGEGPERAAAGLRSFVIASLCGALAAYTAVPGLAAVAVAAVAVLAVVSYARSSVHDPGLTTELALVLMALIGVLSARQPALAAAGGALLAGLLAARDRLHRFATRALTEQELHDGLLLAALVLVLLPLMPAAGLPWMAGLSARQAVALVVLMLSVQAAGHAAVRLLGVTRGLALAGFLGGFVSSTATIASMGARVRAHPAQTGACAGAAVLSAAATWLWALALLAAVSPSAAWGLGPVAGAGAAAAGACGALMLAAARGSAETHDADAERARGSARPLRLREALWVAALLLTVSAVVGWAHARYGTAGAMVAGALGALADAQSSVAALGALHEAARVATDQVVRAIVLAVAANSLVRMLTAFFSGGRGFGQRVTAALLASTAAAAAVAWGLAVAA